MGGEAVPLCREGPPWVVRQEAHGILVLEALEVERALRPEDAP